MQTEPRELRLYILGRTDLESMNAGKLAAQAAHAANQYVHEITNPPEGWTFSKAQLEGFRADHAVWAVETPQGFGTTICLEVSGDVLAGVVAFAQEAGFAAGVTHDPTYPLMDGAVLHLIPLDTCGYVFGEKEALRPLLAQFGLYP